VAFVTHPELPVTNNLAERALRHAVIARRIGFGTRSSEGSLAYAKLLRGECVRLPSGQLPLPILGREYEESVRGMRKLIYRAIKAKSR
jgi:Transposase IS66 family